MRLDPVLCGSLVFGSPRPPPGVPEIIEKSKSQNSHAPPGLPEISEKSKSQNSHGKTTVFNDFQETNQKVKKTEGFIVFWNVNY